MTIDGKVKKEKIYEEIDYDIILKASNGDDEAFMKLYELFRLPLYAFLSRRLNESIYIDDLFQQIWLKILKSLPRYQNQMKFSAWLFRIAQNHLIDHYRGQRRRKYEEVEDYQAVTRENSRDIIDFNEQDEAFKEAVAQLPEKQRELINLRSKNYTFKEIAEMKGCSINTVLGWRQYAIKNINKFLRKREQVDNYEE